MRAEEERRRCSDRGHQGPREMPLSAFSRRAASPDGLQYSCKDCQRRAYRELCAATPGKAAARHKRYRLHTGKVPSPDEAQEHRLRQCTRRARARAKRAALLVECAALVYDCTPGDLMGNDQVAAQSPIYEARCVLTRELRYLVRMSPQEIAALLDIRADTVQRRLEQARRWTRSESGDIRIALRCRRLRVLYRQRAPAEKRQAVHCGQ